MSERRRDRWKYFLCYFPLLGFVPLLAKSSTREVRWHARNGLLLFGALVLVAALVFQQLGCFYSIGMFFAGVIYVIFAALATVKAWQGERLMFPVLSKYADR